MMRLMTNYGMRVDRPQTSIDRLILKGWDYRKMSDADKTLLKLLLDLQHAERERIRFAPIH